MGLGVFAQDSEPIGVRMPPTIVVAPFESRIFRTDSSDALVLECVADGIPKPEYNWLKNGQTLTGFGGRIIHKQDGTIEIPQPGPIDEGYYQCFAKNQHGTTMSRMVQLQRAMLGAYTGKDIYETGMLTEGTSYKLPCMPTKWFPKPFFTWAIVGGIDDKEEKSVTPDKRIQIDEDGNLHFSYVVASDGQNGKLYKCKLFNPSLDFTIGGSYAKMTVKPVAVIQPFAPVNMFKTQSPIIGLEGKDLRLRCFFSGSPDPALSWSKKDGTLPIGSYTITNHNTEILLKNLKQADAGVYICTGQNSQSTATEYITVDVQAEPVFRKFDDSPHDMNVTEGDTVPINCHAYAEPQATVTWLKNGVPISTDNLPPRFRLTDEGKTLIIRDVCKDCSGGTSDLMVIQCNASNVHGYAFSDGYINVLRRTMITIPPANITLSVDDVTAEFEFSATSDDLTPVSLSWVRMEDKSEEKVYSEPNHVFLTEGKLRFYLPHNSTERVKHRGWYRAKASNGYSEAISNFMLQTEDMPFVEAEPVGMGFMNYWWILLLIALILLLLILLLCCCICLQRNKGDSYPVDEKERKNGNNPVKELADSGFHDYHRPDGEPLKGSRASLNSSIKMDSDEEASLNEYGDIDAGKFTEDGSFIGDYSTDRRRGRSTFA